MNDRGDPTKAASRILRERALAILRETRSKIDPALLSAMKERLSPMAAAMKPPSPQAQPIPGAQAQPQSQFQPQAQSLAQAGPHVRSPSAAPEEKPAPALKQGLFKRDYKPVPEESATNERAKAGHASVAPEDIADENGMVPVDRQKIAQIVLQYMKNREDGQKH